MTDNYYHKIDAKGRLFIPSGLRDELGETFYMIITDEECLTAYSNESWERFLDKARAMPMRQQRKMRPFFSNAAKCDLDSQGRFVIPQRLRDRAKLQKDVTIVGLGTCLQIWDTETYKPIAERESTPENLAALIDELDF